MTAIEELKHLRKVLKIEKEEDLEQYRKFVIESEIGERVKNGNSWYPVIITQTGYGRGEQVFVEIERTTAKGTDHQLQTGKRASLFSNVNNQASKQRTEGVIGTAVKDKLRIYLNADELPEWINQGKIGIDLIFDETSYKEMDEALRLVATAENNRLSELREILLGHSPAGFSDLSPSPVNTALNESQNSAIQQIINSNDVAIVHGPPGTGKTTTFVEAIKQVTLQEKQVLVTAPSNTAVDFLCERLDAEGLNVVRIGHPARVGDHLADLVIDNKITQHEYFNDIKNIRKKAEEFRNLAFKYKRNFGKEESRQRQLLFNEARSLKQEAIKLEDYIITDILSNAQVIACTLVGANNQILKDRLFKTVFIDEAAQALEPACWIPIMKAGRVIMAGDHFQLSPTVKSYEAGKQGLSTTLFEKTIERQQVDSLLNVQYRMNAAIMQFSNEQFYDGQLMAAATVKNHKLFNVDENPLLFIDTAGCGFNEKIENSRSAFNPEEGNLLLSYLNDFLQQFCIADTEAYANVKRIGIISPYKAQVAYLGEQIENFDYLLSNKHKIRFNTVDGFQGQECDLIAISLVRSNDKNEIGFLADTRRMNVAMTRAKKKLLIIGDSATLSSHQFYKSFFEHVQINNSYQSAWELTYLQ
ncbi:AAA domain-containing protein [Solitalea sp. MAHUQ-68]|uniref:AAA domain-containing protein n=1 Tax=Solitalea agri TaxID=2953739 RepID=A0A9X2JE86_9SPHI|nr:AAA domain-containing protein [Solitalea agri]MCO4294474.1 AAA domain-containing protein [Solitalea agri]